MSKTRLAINEEKLVACVHCGFCLPACPTHVITGEEMPSPRGRLYLMRMALEGRVSIDDPAFVEHELTCLVCRACETACPSGVEFGFLMEQTRAEIRSAHGSGRLRNWIYRSLLPDRKKLRILQIITYGLGKLGILALGRRIGTLLPNSSKLGSVMRLAPRNVKAAKTRPTVYSAIGKKRGAVALLLGCVGEAFTSKLNDDTISVLTNCGYDVHTLPRLVCCGALPIHAGYRAEALRLADRAMEITLAEGVSHIISNIAGCGAMLKDYEHLFESGEQTETAKVFRLMVRDITEFLVEEAGDLLRKSLADSDYSGTIAWQAPCHLLHGQRVIDPPRQLLSMLPRATVIDLPENELCCGSAGSYNIEQPEWSNDLLRRKMSWIDELRPRIVATANAGCLLQLQKGVREEGIGVEVKHIIEILAETIELRKIGAIADGAIADG